MTSRSMHTQLSRVWNAIQCYIISQIRQLHQHSIALEPKQNR